MAGSMKLRRNLRAFRTQLKYLPWAIRLVWNAAGWWTPLWIVLLTLQGILPVGVLYASRALIDNLAGVLGTPTTWTALQPIIVLLGIVAVLMLTIEVLRNITGLVQTVQAERVETVVGDMIHAQALDLDLAFYETSEGYDQLHRARTDALTRPIALVESLGTMLQNGLLLVSMVGVLATFGLWLPLLLVVSALPSLVVVLRSTVQLNAWRLRTTAHRRRTQYFTWLLTSREAAAELRLFGLGRPFRDEWTRLRHHVWDERFRLARKQATGETLAGGITLLALAVTLGVMLLRASLRLCNARRSGVILSGVQSGAACRAHDVW